MPSPSNLVLMVPGITDWRPPATKASLPLSISPLPPVTPWCTFLAGYHSCCHLRLFILPDFGVHFFHLTPHFRQRILLTNAPTPFTINRKEAHYKAFRGASHLLT